MGNSLCTDNESKRPREYLAKQTVSLFFPDQEHNVQSQMCDKSCVFSLEDDSFHAWWRLRTRIGDIEVIGTASRLHFYPADSTREEDKETWYFGEMSRAECEELLSHSANDQGAFMVRLSSKHKRHVLSVKIFNDQMQNYQYRHFTIRHTPNWGHGTSSYSLGSLHCSSLTGLVASSIKEDNSFPLSNPCLVPNPVSDKTVLRRWEIQVQADRWMVPRQELVLGVELGHGYFGSVHRGVWRQNMEVAIKTLRHKEGKTEAEYLKEKTTFLSETEIMKDLNHPNLVKMLGICVEKSPFYLVQELCQNGDLKHYLKTFEFVKVYQNINYLQSKSKKSEKLKSVPSFNSLVNWCSDILKGMCYLESHNLVHRDLAARNILLDDHLKAKVADFGLTMKDNQEVNEEKPAMAVLWSAPEAIEKKEFSIKSDVWSYGVTMWEILSYGEKPYSGLKKEAVKEKLRSSNYMMDPPPNYMRCDKEAWAQSYQIMKECWNKTPRLRPKFKSLLLSVMRLQRTKLYKREAWSGAKSGTRRSNSFNLNISERDVEDYDLSDQTSTYTDYDDVFRTMSKNID